MNNQQTNERETKNILQIKNNNETLKLKCTATEANLERRPTAHHDH